MFERKKKIFIYLFIYLDSDHFYSTDNEVEVKTENLWVEENDSFHILTFLINIFLNFHGCKGNVATFKNWNIPNNQ